MLRGQENALADQPSNKQMEQTTWFSNSPNSPVKVDGFREGAKAAAKYLLEVMRRGDVQTVMETLPRIHADVKEPDGKANKPNFGIFGFYCGATNTAVRVEHEYKEGGAERVALFLDHMNNKRSS